MGRRTLDEQRKAEESHFLGLRLSARQLEATLDGESRLKGELEDVKRKLQVFESAGHAVVLSKYQRADLQRNAISAWEEEWERARGKIEELREVPLPESLAVEQFDTAVPSEKELIELAQATTTALSEIVKRLDEVTMAMNQAVASWRENLGASEWKSNSDLAVQGYDELCKRLEKEAAGDPGAYSGLVRLRQEIEKKLKGFAAKRDDLATMRRDEEGALLALRATRRALTEARRSFIESVLRDNRYVKIEVVPYGSSETAEAEIRGLLQREEGFAKDIGRAGVGGMLGTLFDGSMQPSEFEKRLDDFKQRLASLRLGDSTSHKVEDKRFATHVSKLPPEAFDELLYWFPEDSLNVQYSTQADGSNYRPIQAGSPGQKTAALLAFLLSYGDEPVILDQPEDDLDNNLIYELIVKQIRRIKSRRQVIVVTHNANVVVNGDAELVVALAAKTGETHMECCGSLQDRTTRERICAILEGGAEAFEQRYRRIALPG